MSSPTANEATVYEAVRAIIAPLPLDKIVGQPTTSTVNHLRQQIAKIAAAVKTTSWGGRHGHLALVLTDAEYRTVTGNPDITVDCLPTPPIVAAGLTNTTTLTNRASITGLHNLACQEFWKQEAVNALIVDKLVREAVDPTHVEELEGDYVGYSAKRSRRSSSISAPNGASSTTLEKNKQPKPSTSNGTSRAISRSLPVNSTSSKSSVGTSVSRPQRPRRSNITSRACTPPTCSTTRKCRLGKSSLLPTKPGTRLRHTSLPSTRARKSLTPGVKRGREGSERQQLF
eukprot:CCRYP_015757-RA/>CCRYP_015757-RA protein AED:0.83 eAED:0.82 QI:0/-1/0/1/-1/1/1/0/285